MKVVESWPPNIEKIKQRFPNAPLGSAVFAWGNELYNPGKWPIPDHLMVHEDTHGRQHAAFPGGVTAWWDKYLTDNQFLLSQEIEAYSNQYKFVKAKSSRQVTREFLKKVAKDLSGSLYGNICTFEFAKGAIQNAAN